jgi:hypothetical protein
MGEAERPLATVGDPPMTRSGARYDPMTLANLSWGQIAVTGDKPGEVCTSTRVTPASGSI